MVSALRRIVAAYNKRVHSALHGMTPEQVISNPVNEWRLRLRRYPWLARRGGTPKRASIDPRALPLGSWVRVRMDRVGEHFKKGTDATATKYSHSVYQIIRYDLMFSVHWVLH